MTGIQPSNHDGEPLAVGVAGIDDILRGGFPNDCLYLISGMPGSGKTTLAMQFLMEGVRVGERALYITLSESRPEMEKVARSHGWDISGIEFCELIPSESNLGPRSAAHGVQSVRTRAR